MDAIHINTKLDSDTPYLPQVRPLIGKNVEITVQEQVATGGPKQNDSHPQRAAWKVALADLAELDFDWDAYKRQREFEVRNANDLI